MITMSNSAFEADGCAAAHVKRLAAGVITFERT